MRATALLALTAEIIDDATGLTSLRGKSGIYDFSRKLNLGHYQIQRIFRELEKQNLISKTQKGFLITPKGRVKVRNYNLQQEEKSKNDEWDGRWRIVIFDIPEDQRRARNLFRATLKRKGYIELQQSVFVYPYGNFNILNQIRHEMEIEGCVSFLIAKADEVEDDKNLRIRFSLA